MSAEIKLGLLLGSFALLCTVHLFTVIGLFAKPTPSQGLIALVVPPAAPLFAWQRGTRVRATLWGVFAALYIVVFAVAR